MLDSQTLLLSQHLDLLSLRQRVTATNIANVDTPGYRTRGFDFQWELAQALRGSSEKPRLPVAVQEVGNLAAKNDGNDVSLERELRNLAETAMLYRLAAQAVHGNLQAVRAAIREGRS